MALTKEDLAAIRGIVAETFETFEGRIDKKIRGIVEEIVDAKLAPIQETLKALLKTQVDIVQRIQFLEFQIEGLKRDFYNLNHEVTGFKHELASLRLELAGKADIKSWQNQLQTKSPVA